MPLNVIRNEEEHLYAAQPETEAGRLLGAALLRLRRAEHVHDRRALRESGLSMLDFRALRYLVQAHRDGRKVSPKDLMVMLGTSSANVTNVVDRLVNRGHAVRRVNPADRRAYYLIPTDDAIVQVDELIGSHHSVLVAQINQLDDEQAAIAASVLQQFAAALDEVESGFTSDTRR